MFFYVQFYTLLGNQKVSARHFGTVDFAVEALILAERSHVVLFKVAAFFILEKRKKMLNF